MLYPVRRSTVVAVTLALACAAGSSALVAQVPGPNINMVSGTTLPDGDPFLQRQNEPSLAVSTRNPQHILAGANDYRTVDLPGLPDDLENGDAWVGVYKSTDGGQTWRSTLLAGFPQDSSLLGRRSPLHGFNAAADPTVRAGANGLFFYSGIAFNRGEKAPGAVFVARFTDDNNKENGDPFRYLGTSLVAKESTAKFLDKPWLAVDQPRGDASCVVGGERLAAGTVYIAYTVFNGPGAAAAAISERDDDDDDSEDQRRPDPRRRANDHDRNDRDRHGRDHHDRDEEELRGRIMFSRSRDCGATWSSPMRISSARDINQGATIAIDPSSGTVYVAWRQFADPEDGTEDAFFVAHSHNGGKSFEDPVRIARIHPFDQGTTGTSIRTTAFPTMAIDRRGRVYLAWAARGFAAKRPDPETGDSRIVLSMSQANDGSRWTAPRVIDDSSDAPGHQIMPALAFAAGRLQLAYYDLREDYSQTFEPYLDDFNLPTRHTIDVRSAQAIAGPDPVFTSYSVVDEKPSYRVSEYARGSRPGGQDIEQLEFNVPNLPLFKQGTVPFLGDYLDVAAAPAFVVTPGGRWVFNTSTESPAVFHIAWTDNRNVSPPNDGNWANYTPPNYTGPLLDGQQVAACSAGQTGMRNQNVYTAQISTGLVAGSPGNAKPLSSTLQRSFVVFARNTTTTTRSYQLGISKQPVGGRASFSQFPAPPFGGTPPPPVTVDYVTVPPLSMAARTVYATSTDPSAGIDVSIVEVDLPGGPRRADGQSAMVSLNADNTNPAITNPDIQDPAITNPDIRNSEVSNPAITNPAITNPAITNPAITNPDIASLRVVNPDITNPAITNPAITNPAITNPAITNPAITNPDIANGSITDVTWTVTNTGNTAAAYSTKLFLTSATIPDGFKFQLIVHKAYETPVAIDCNLKTETHNEVLVNVNDTAISQQFTSDNVLAPTDVTFVVNPGEQVKITVRIVDSSLVDGNTFDVAHALVPAIQAQAVNSDAVVLGVTEPPAVTPPSVRTLAFAVEPSTATAGQPIAPPIRVQLAGLGGVPVASQALRLSLGTNPWGASLSGATVAVTDANGIATFSSVAVTVPGDGYRLLASMPAGGPTAASQLFTVAAQPGPSVDVAVAASHTPAAPVLGGALTTEVVVTTNGAQPATNVTLSAQLADGAAFVSALASQGTCTHANGSVTCQLGTVVSGNPVTVSIVETPSIARLVTTQVFVSASETDTNAANNIATDTVTAAPTADGVVGLYTVSYLNNASGCAPGQPNPFACNYLLGPVRVDPSTTPAGTYRVDIVQPLDPANQVGGFRVWDGSAAVGTQYSAGDVFHHLAGNIDLYAHDWYPWDNPPGSGWQVAVYRLGVDPVIEDTFEGAILDSAWTTVSSQFGTISLSAAENTTAGGHQSLSMSSTSGGQRSMILERGLGGLTQGTATIKFNDTAPNLETLYTNFTLVDSVSGVSATIGTADFDAFCYKAVVIDPATNTNYGQNANCGLFPQPDTTNIARTSGWHEFSIRWDSHTVALTIDGQQVFEMAGTFNFDKAHVDLSGPGFRPNATYFFDDFSIRP